MRRRGDVCPVPAPAPQPDDGEELDPRVQRFLRFMVETAVRSLIRERDEGGAEQHPADEAERAAPSDAAPVQSKKRKK